MGPAVEAMGGSRVAANEEYGQVATLEPIVGTLTAGDVLDNDELTPLFPPQW